MDHSKVMTRILKDTRPNSAHGQHITHSSGFNSLSKGVVRHETKQTFRVEKTASEEST